MAVAGRKAVLAADDVGEARAMVRGLFEES